MGTLTGHKLLLASALLACFTLPVKAEPSIAGTYLMAQSASQAGDWPQAARLYTALYRRDPQPDLLRQAFLLSLGAGDMPTALDLAGRITPDMPEALIATSLQVAAFTKAGNTAEASRLLDQLPRRGLALPFISLVQAWLLGTRGGPDALPAALDQLAGLEELETLQILHTAMLAEIAGKPKMANAAYATLAADPTPRLSMLAASYYRRSAQPKLAAGLLAKLRAADPTDLAALSVSTAPASPEPKPTLQSGLGEVYYDMAELLLDGGHPDIALLYAQMGIYVSGNTPGLLFLRGTIESEQSRYATAVTDLQVVPARFGFGLLAAIETINNRQLAGDNAGALAGAAALITKYPALAEPRIVLADLQRRNGNNQAARQTYTAALAHLRPADSRRGTLLFARGVVEDQLHDDQAAEADLHQSIALSPHEALTLNYLGYFWAERNEHLAEAHALLAEAAQLAPDDGSIADSLGWVLYRQQDYAGAVVQLEKAVALRPGDSNINAHLGDAYWQAGREREADFQWRHALLNARSTESGALEARLRGGLPAVAVPATAESHAELLAPSR